MKNNNLEDVASLIYACNSGNLSLADALIKNGANVNEEDREHRTPLIYACKNGYSNIAKLLIEHGADINKMDVEDKTPLIYACIGENKEIVSMLAQNGANLELSDNKDKTPLIYTCERGNQQVLNILLEAGCNINKPNKKNLTPLMDACKKGDIAVIDMLIENGADIDMVDESSGWTALNYACMYNHIKIIDKLIDGGAEINREDGEGDTILSLAIASAKSFMINHLLNKGVDIEKINSYRSKVIETICKCNDRKMICVLLENGLNPQMLEDTYKKRGAFHKWNELSNRFDVKKILDDMENLKLSCMQYDFNAVNRILEDNKDSVGYRKVALKYLINDVKNNEEKISKEKDNLIHKIIVDLQDKGSEDLKRWGLGTKNVEIIDELIKHAVITPKNMTSNDVRRLIDILQNTNSNRIGRLLQEYVRNDEEEIQIDFNTVDEEAQVEPKEIIDYKRNLEVSVIKMISEKTVLGPEAKKKSKISTFMEDLGNMTEYKNEPKDAGLKIFMGLIEKQKELAKSNDKEVINYMQSMCEVANPLTEEQEESEKIRRSTMSEEEINNEIKEKYLKFLDGMSNNVEELYKKLINNTHITAAPSNSDDRRKHYDTLLNGFRVIGEIIKEHDYMQIDKNIMLISDLNNWCAEAWKDTLEEMMVMYREEIYSHFKEKIGVSQETDKIKRRLNEIFFEAKDTVAKKLGNGAIDEFDIHEDYRPHCIDIYNKYLNETYGLNLPQTNLKDSFAQDGVDQNKLSEYFEKIRENFIEYLKDKDVEELITKEMVDRYLEILSGPNAQKTQNEVVDWTYSYMLNNNIKDISRHEFLTEYIYDDTITSIRKMAIEEILRDKGYISRELGNGIEQYEIKLKTMKALNYCEKEKELPSVKIELKILMERLGKKSEEEIKETVYSIACGIIKSDKWKDCLDLIDICLRSIPGEKENLFVDIIEKNDVELLDKMRERGLQIDKPDSENHATPLMYACMNGSVEIVDYLVRHGAQINIGDDEGTTPLMYAITGSNIGCVEYLLKHGVDVNMRQDDKVTALICACLMDNLEITKLLVNKGTEINAQEEKGFFPLGIASQNGNLELAEYLIKNGAQISMENKEGNTALIAACLNGYTNVADMLIKHGAQIEHTNKEGNTPIMEACKYGYLDLVKYLYRAGAKIDKVNENGDDAIALAINNNRLKVVEFIAKRMPNINRIDKQGLTPLMLAITTGNKDMTEILLENGANIHLKNSKGQDALYIAKSMNNKEITDLLEQKLNININKEVKLEK